MTPIIGLVMAVILGWRGFETEGRDGFFILAGAVFIALTTGATAFRIWTPAIGWLSAVVAFLIAYGIRRVGARS